MSRSRIALVSMLLVCAAALAGAETPYRETYEQTFPLAATGTVALKNVNGDVTIETWDREEVRVYALKEAASRELLEALEIEVDVGSRTLNIETHYPSSRGDLLGSWRDGHMRVEYTLTVPRQAGIHSVDLVNGNLKVVGVEGGVSAHCVNGTIVLRRTHGAGNLSTVNGGIEVHGRGFAAGDKLNLESVNGSVDLYLPGSVGAEIDAKTVNGFIGNDLGLEVRKGKYVGSNLHGVIGDGAVQIDIETVNGAITLHRYNGLN